MQLSQVTPGKPSASCCWSRARARPCAARRASTCWRRVSSVSEA